MKNKTLSGILSNVFGRWMWMVWRKYETLLRFISQRAYKRVNIMLNSFLFIISIRGSRRELLPVFTSTLFDQQFCGLILFLQDSVQRKPWSKSPEKAQERKPFSLQLGKQNKRSSVVPWVCVFPRVCAHVEVHTENRHLWNFLVCFSPTQSR